MFGPQPLSRTSILLLLIQVTVRRTVWADGDPAAATAAAAAAGVASYVEDHDSQNKQDLHEWVVHVPKGREAAVKFAAEHDLELLGEVVPDSNEFHVASRSRQSHRSKRSFQPDPHAIEKRILRHQDVHWAERQAAKRWKFIPYPYSIISVLYRKQNK